MIDNNTGYYIIDNEDDHGLGMTTQILVSNFIDVRDMNVM